MIISHFVSEKIRLKLPITVGEIQSLILEQMPISHLLKFILRISLDKNLSREVELKKKYSIKKWSNFKNLCNFHEKPHQNKMHSNLYGIEHLISVRYSKKKTGKGIINWFDFYFVIA